MEQQLHSKVINGKLVQFDKRDLSNGCFVVPNFITEIGEYAFADCKALKQVVLTKNVNSISSGAFMNCVNLTQVKLGENIKEIPNNCFWGCKSLNSLNLQKVQQIGNGAFFSCDTLNEVDLSLANHLGSGCFYGCKNLKTVKLSPNLQQVKNKPFGMCDALTNLYVGQKQIKMGKMASASLSDIYHFLCYAVNNNKFLPNNIGIMENTSHENIEKFYAKTKDWKQVLTAYTKKWEHLFNNETYFNSFSKDIFSNLYQVSFVLGLFEPNNKKALEFIAENIIEISPSRLHKLYGKLDTKNNGYNAEFAEFYMKNYTGATEVENSVKLYFMEQIVKAEDEEDGFIMNYTAPIYNNWEKIKEVYPNKMVVAHREHASEYNNLTLTEIITALKEIQYDNVKKGNEELAYMASKYGYKQASFETLQNWYETAKLIKPEEMVLKLNGENQNTEIQFNLLSKNDIEAIFIGEKTNCCQTVESTGKTCVGYGLTKPNSGFVKFTYNGKIIGQAWVWYNYKSQVVCLDNIEIPLIWMKRIKKDENLVKSFQECLINMANSFKSKMNQTDYKVKNVTIGAGFVDLPGMECFKKIKVNEDHLPEDYAGYSDASVYQYVIPEKYSELNLDEMYK